MLFFLLGMDKRLRLNLILLGVIFGVGILPDKNVEAGKCYLCAGEDCRSLADTPEDPLYKTPCSSNVCKTYFFTDVQDNKEVLSALRNCEDLTPDQKKCAQDKLGSKGGCFAGTDPRLQEALKCVKKNGGGGGYRTGPFEFYAENTNGTNQRSASAKQYAGQYKDITMCYCNGDLCNNMKAPSGVGGGKGKASVVSSNNLTLFFAILGAVFGCILISGGHLNRNIMKG